MNKHTDKPSMGLLMLHGSEKFRLSRYIPAGRAGFFIKHYWIVSWDLTGQEPHLQEVVPNPCVNLVIQNGSTGIYAPAKQKYSCLIEGKGAVFGVKFKPGGFYPFIRQPVTILRDGPMNVQSILGAEARALETSILSLTDEDSMVKLIEPMFEAVLPGQDETVTLINEMIDRIIADREMTKVDQLADRFGMNKRKLQRLFEQYVGISPKSVIRLYRLQHAAESLDLSRQHDWMELSLSLGYYDQAHFIKDFKAVIGRTPEDYVRAQA
ncbi:AraC family transcriptional regulator [Paenibacillus piri]|uniref:AraC family transcriptional regulator n=1 Tax=Paenibacillus piri TaxID=2547395 RepID=A0A4R5KAZ6_9BACL|nr:helix-turn-helix domain-containing protein [Paenibacillus piri]TDF92309.1 AraC family transcriptional regulator [Paenibacillus piri]